MSREDDMLRTIAKEYVSEEHLKSSNPEYKGVLNKHDFIEKLTIILGKEKKDVIKEFDSLVDLYRKQYKFYNE